MFNENFAHGKKFTFNSDNLPFTTLDEVVAENGNKVITVREVFINHKAKYGARPCLVCDTLKINLPNHFVKDIEKILASQEYIDAINAGSCGFQPTQYQDKNGVTRNSGKFVDI